MDGLRDTQWLLWLAAALTAGLIEIVSLDLDLGRRAGLLPNRRCRPTSSTPRSSCSRVMATGS